MNNFANLSINTSLFTNILVDNKQTQTYMYKRKQTGTQQKDYTGMSRV